MREARAIRMTTAQELASTIAELLTNDAERNRLGESARAFAAAQGGAAAKCANLIEELTAMGRRQV
jgi:UDP:flavonoid glycosyltransferase YjiC (YdhE family)